MPPKARSLRKTATSAARAALNERANFIGELADTQAAIDTLKATQAAAEQKFKDQLAALQRSHQDQLVAINTAHSEAYQAALAAGWNDNDIANFGLRIPSDMNRTRSPHGITKTRKNATTIPETRRPLEPSPTHEEDTQLLQEALDTSSTTPL